MIKNQNDKCINNNVHSCNQSKYKQGNKIILDF